MKVLTPEEVEKLGLRPIDKFALINTKSNTVFVCSNVAGSCEEVFEAMKNNNHKLVPDLELVQQAA